jgi:hypothetical protein
MKNELMDKKKRLMLLTFLVTFLFARKGVPILIHVIYLIIIGLLIFCKLPSFLTIPPFTVDSVFLEVMAIVGWLGFVVLGITWLSIE